MCAFRRFEDNYCSVSAIVDVDKSVRCTKRTESAHLPASACFIIARTATRLACQRLSFFNNLHPFPVASVQGAVQMWAVTCNTLGNAECRASCDGICGI